MNDQYRIFAGGVLGAIVGAAAGYLFFTNSGRTMRDQIDPAVDTLRVEFAKFQKVLEKVGAIANEGVRVANEFGYARAQPSFQSRPTSH